MIKQEFTGFTILNIDISDNTKYPVLQFIVDVAKQCYDLDEYSSPVCVKGLSYGVGEYYGKDYCKNLNIVAETYCYSGFGRKIIKESLDVDILKEECSKTNFHERCLVGGALAAGEFINDLDVCKNFEKEILRQECSMGIGRQLAYSNKEENLCYGLKYKEYCLIGYAYIIEQLGNKEKAKIIYDNIKNDRTWFYIGANLIRTDKQTVEDAIKTCQLLKIPDGGAIYFYSYKSFIKN